LKITQLVTHPQIAIDSAGVVGELDELGATVDWTRFDPLR
jgi:hypothetical protein